MHLIESRIETNTRERSTVPADDRAAPEEHISVSSTPTTSERAFQANVDASLDVLLAALGHLEAVVGLVQRLKAKVEAKDEEVKVPLQRDLLVVERVARDEIHTLKTEAQNAGDKKQRAHPVRSGAAPKPALTHTAVPADAQAAAEGAECGPREGGECGPREALKLVSAGEWQAVALLPSSLPHVTCVRKQQQQTSQRKSQSTQPALYLKQPALYHSSTVSGSSAAKEEVAQEQVEEDAMVELVLATEADEEEAAQEKEKVEEDAMIELVLDMHFAEVEDVEDEFKSQVALDVARALGGDVNKVHIVKMEAGSIFLQIRLASGIYIHTFILHICIYIYIYIL